MADTLRDHISGVAQGNLNAADPLFGIDGNAYKDPRDNPEALGQTADKVDDAKFWVKNGKKLRQQVITVAAGTAEKNATLQTIASVVTKFGKPVINAKYQAALDTKKFGHYLDEKKEQASGQFGQEEARHAVQMQFTKAQNTLSQAIFRANVQLRYNQLQRTAEVANRTVQEAHRTFVAESAMQLGTRARSLAAPTEIPQPPSVNTNPSFSTSIAPGMPGDVGGMANHSTGRGLFGVFGWLGRMVGGVRRMFGI
jgi:hypothetical protein